MGFRRTVKIITTWPRLKFQEKVWLNKFGWNTWVAGNVHITKSVLGESVYVSYNCIINYAKIGNYCSIAPGVQIGGMEHGVDKLSTSAHISEEYTFGNYTEIGEDVWIGAGSIIKQGIKIGRGAIIGAHSFVNKDVPPYSVFFGSPAKLYKYRFSDDTIQKLEESHYWEKRPEKAAKLLNQIKQSIQ